ncbi:MAG TPA: hypothetical protein VFF06_24850 [Polyangia bacterium]|nr:hypothetical protein [Polyangia bacterium]
MRGTRSWRTRDGGVLIEGADAVALERAGYRFVTPANQRLDRAHVFYLVGRDGRLARVFESRMGSEPAQEGYIDTAFVVEGDALHAWTCSWDCFEPFPSDAIALDGLLPPDGEALDFCARLGEIVADDERRRAEERRRRDEEWARSAPAREAEARRAEERRRVEARARGVSETRLAAPDALPELDGAEPFDAVAEVDEHEDLIVRAGERVVWRERLRGVEREDVAHGAAIEPILRARYGPRLRAFHNWIRSHYDFLYGR